MNLRRIFLSTVLTLAGKTTFGQATESPSTVAPGSWFVEADLMSVSFHRDSAASGTLNQTTTVVGAVFVTTGITQRFGLQLGTELYHRDRVELSGMRDVVSGRGDTFVRAKWNFMGDESEGLSLALLPWVKIPTAADGGGNDETDWGIIVPFGMPLADGGTFNAMVELARPADGTGGRETTWFFGAVMLRPLAERWEWYAEATAGFVRGTNPDSTGTFRGGLRWALAEKVVFDLGLAAGLTDSSPELSPVLRMEWSF